MVLGDVLLLSLSAYLWATASPGVARVPGASADRAPQVAAKKMSPSAGSGRPVEAAPASQPAREDKLADILRRIDAVERLRLDDDGGGPQQSDQNRQPRHRRQGLADLGVACVALVGGDARLLPGSATIVGAAARLQLHGSELEIDATYLAPVKFDDGGQELQLSGWALGLTGGLLLAASRLGLRLGLGPVLGRLSGDSRGIAPSFERRYWWAGLRAGVRTRLRLYRHLFVEFGLDGQLNLARPKFTRRQSHGGLREVHSPPWTSLRSVLGLGGEFRLKP